MTFIFTLVESSQFNEQDKHLILRMANLRMDNYKSIFLALLS